ncbi:rod shape-determining protein MreC [Slackia heliotrinireducens]|uniref:Cell shape-determining protein MreC n=1 Tax=Slackia heliotrinireducens (strain ATCC 29202 / DSM 20476 / NCTC 11029 / RHS 1) TaxID=471855 RepID=C7N6A8_SLAHD|nr:rod shape-determining protein MreC [Slackia heliotrinireducens]ACV22443.1 rod shape-determining protein MreC [Slackia heliotrinireducens DSM 20476]VEH00799.1 rod shape-determining protein MreC [Slackia heliotrinireducens]
MPYGNSNQHMSGSSKGNILMVALLALSLVVASVYARESDEGILHNVQDVFAVASTPFAYMNGAIGSAEQAAGESIADARADASSLTELQQENAELRAALAEAEEYRLEAERLQGLLELQDMYSFNLVTGRIIGAVPNAWDRVITVNVGTKQGLEAGMPVIGPGGLIGQVIDVTPVTCEIRLLDDPASGVSVMLQSSRGTGVVSGSLEGLLYLENVDPSVNVEVGDVVMTSGMGGTYYAGLPVGTVLNVDASSGTSDRTIIVAPFASTGSLEEVSIILSMAEVGETDLEAEGSDEVVADGEGA